MNDASGMMVMASMGDLGEKRRSRATQAQRVRKSTSSSSMSREPSTIDIALPQHDLCVSSSGQSPMGRALS